MKNLNQNSGLKARLQIWKQDPLTILDVSHNPAGIKSTLETIEQLNKGNLHIIYGTSSDKDISSILDEFPSAAKIYLTEITNPRSANISQLEKASKGKKFESVDYFFKAESAFKIAQNTAKQKDTILIIGSFFLVADFF